MDYKQLRRYFGLITFIIATVVYLLTVQDSVPFWDCSEFSAAAYLQQVPHPPGAPLFLMVGKMFDLLIPFGDAGWKMNLLAVFSSSFTIWFLYSITVMVIEAIIGRKPKDLGEAISVYGSGMVAGLALTFSDTFWFNAVESEVYASATLFVAIVLYLMMRWNEESDNPGHERYLMLMAYVIGLSTGVHLLAILAIPSITLLIYFKKYTVTPKSLFYMIMITGVIFIGVYPGIVKWLPAFLAGHTPWKTEAHEYVASSPMFTYLAVAAILGMIYAMYWGYRNNKRLVNLIASSFLLILLGYSTYTQILIRSNSNPPMNENEPKDFEKLAAYLGREQYGSDAAWPRRIKTDQRFTDRYKQQNADGSYVYGPWTPPGKKEIYDSEGRGYSTADWSGRGLVSNPDIFWGEINYLIKYQMRHMYFRYFYWNYVGRASDVQDSRETWFGSSAGEKQHIISKNYKSGYADKYPVRFFALPFLLGLIGMVFHFYRDPRSALIFLISFLLMGVIAAVAQQQQDPQPRERDYFYTGSFLIWSMWIGMSVWGLVEMLKQKELKPAISASVLIVVMLLAPINMAVGGWYTHDRTGNYIPFDYSYNILQSAEENAIIFTNGDNDTFPVWYLQDVMGVRRDVRIVNLSLGNTLWYVDQLKNRKPWGAEKIPLSFSDNSLRTDELAKEALQMDYFPAQVTSILVRPEILAEFTDNKEIISRGFFNETFKGMRLAGKDRQGREMYVFRVQDQVIYEILKKTKFERPVYFSTTVGPDAYAGLEPYFRYEGMLMRVCPVKQGGGIVESMNLERMGEILMNIDNSNDYHKEPHFGFKLRNLNNPDVYYDPVHRRLMMTYRELYKSYAKAVLDRENDKEKAIKVLDFMNEMISVEQFPLEFLDEYEIAQFYKRLGENEQYEFYRDKCIESCTEILASDYIRTRYKMMEASQRVLGPHRLLSNMLKERGDFAGARDALNKLMTLTQSARSRTPESDYQARQIIEVNIIDIQTSLIELDVDELIAMGDIEKAQALLSDAMAELDARNDQAAGYIKNQLIKKLIELNQLTQKSQGDTIAQN